MQQQAQPFPTNNNNMKIDYPDEAQIQEPKEKKKKGMFGFLKKVTVATGSMAMKGIKKVKENIDEASKKKKSKTGAETGQTQQMAQPQITNDMPPPQPQFGQQNNNPYFNPQQQGSFNNQNNFNNSNYGNNQFSQPQMLNNIPNNNFNPNFNNDMIQFQGNYYQRNNLSHYKMYKPLSSDLDMKKTLKAAEVLSTQSGHTTVGKGLGNINNAFGGGQNQHAQAQINSNSDEMSVDNTLKRMEQASKNSGNKELNAQVKSAQNFLKVGKSIATIDKFANAFKSKLNTVKNDIMSNPFNTISDKTINEVQGRNEIEKLNNLINIMKSKKNYLSRKQCLYIFTNLGFEDSKLYFANTMGPYVKSVDVDVIGLMCNETYFCKYQVISGFWRYLDKETPEEHKWNLLDLIQDKKEKNKLRKEMGVKKKGILGALGLGAVGKLL